MSDRSCASCRKKISVGDEVCWFDNRPPKFGLMAAPRDLYCGEPCMRVAIAALKCPVVKFRKRPVVVEAVQLTWRNWAAVCEFAGVPDRAEGCFVDKSGAIQKEGTPDDGLGLLIRTLEGNMLALEGDWIIKGVKGELYPCKPEIFAATYELAEAST